MSAVIEFQAPAEPVEPLAGFEDLPPILSPVQLARALDVSVRTLERWRAARTGPAFQHPTGTKIYRYYRQDVLDWLENKKPVVAATGQDI